MAKGGSSGFGKFILGILFGFVLIVAGLWLYLRYGNVPVAVADKAFPYEEQIVQVPMNARIARDMKQPPFGTSEDVYEAGAHIYREQCAACHGIPGKDAPYAKYMYPDPPPLWQKHSHGTASHAGVSDDDPGETYWKVANGIRLTGMPSYAHILNDTQMWQVTLLLKNADQQLPDPVTKILTAP